MSARAALTTFRAVLDVPDTPSTPAPQAFTNTWTSARAWATSILASRPEGSRVLIYRVEEFLAETMTTPPPASTAALTQYPKSGPKGGPTA